VRARRICLLVNKNQERDFASPVIDHPLSGMGAALADMGSPRRVTDLPLGDLPYACCKPSKRIRWF